MAIPITTEWTIVILGRWNRAIFNPKWLTENIFDDSSVRLEVPMEPWLPARITGDHILLIPGEDRLIIGLTEVNDEQLQKMEDVAVKFLGFLSHTPVAKLGMNFGFRDDGAERWSRSNLPNPLAALIGQAGLTSKGRSCTWSFEHAKRDSLNITCSVFADKLEIKFNFDLETPTAIIAKDKLAGKLFDNRDKAISILSALFGLDLEVK